MQRMNSRDRTKPLTEDEVAFQVEFYKSMVTKYAEELADDQKTIERCYSIGRFIY
jgi:hypothetical protein